jgi:hypothetical protein
MDREFRKRSQIVHYRHLLKQSNVNLAKHYLDGELALVLDCAFQRQADAVGAIASHEIGVPGFQIPFLIFHNDALSVYGSRYWNEQPMLVRDVHVVKHFNEAIPTNCVRLYVGDDPVKEFRTKNIYFSPSQSAFYFFPGLRSGEFGVTIKCSASVPFDGSAVGVINRRPEIMESISNNQRHNWSEFGKVSKCVDDILRSNTLVTLDSGTVTVLHRSNELLQVRNVFIGPFNFESSGCESINHDEGKCTAGRLG